MLKRFPRSALSIMLVNVGLCGAWLAPACATSGKTTARNSSGQNSQNMNSQSDSAQNSAQNSAQSSATLETVSRDIEALGKEIELPIRPRAVVWQAGKLGNPNNQAPGPSDYRLTAVLKFDQAEIKTLLEKIESPAPASSGTVRVEKWFPEDLKKIAEAANDKSTLEGKKYNADQFLRSPYTSGTLIQINETDYFVLKLLSF